MGKQRQCEWCRRGFKKLLLDADGTNVAVSGRQGAWGHASGDYFWPCGPAVNPSERNAYDILGSFEQAREQSR